MINLFSFGANDLSCGYLQSIFGTMNGYVCNPSGATPSGTSITILGTMFQTFNSVVLAVGVLVVVYVTVVGLMMTAQEGEFMGKKWNNLWLPIRAVLGIAALVPFGGGYSMIQYIIMWVIVQGIGAADTLWSTAINYTNSAGSVYAQGTIPTVQATQVMGQLLQGLICDASGRVSAADPTNLGGSGNYYCNKKTNPGFCGQGVTFPQPNTKCSQGICNFTLGPNASCGTLQYADASSNGACKDASSLACAAAQAQIQALQSVIPSLAATANSFVTADYQFRDFRTNSKYNDPNNPNGQWSWIYAYCSNNQIPLSQCCVPPSDPVQQFLNPQQVSCQATGDIFPSGNGGTDNTDSSTASNDAVTSLYTPFYPDFASLNNDLTGGAINSYMTTLQNAFTTWSKNQGQTNQLSDVLNNARDQGWIMAGGYYYALAGMNSNNLNDAMPTLSMTVASPAASKNSMSNYRNNYIAASVFVNNGSANLSGMNAPQLGGAGSAVGEGMNDVTNQFSSMAGNTSGGGTSNPMIQLQIAGKVMIVVAEVIFIALIAITLVIGLAGGISVYVLGTGVSNPVDPALSLIYMLFIPLLYAFLAFLITMGALLAIYVPLIPYIVFTFGAIGWLIATIEAMVAGPLVALGILSPSGQHELLGKAEPALLLLFSIFLRPSLMIFGLIASMLLAVVVVKMINFAFWNMVFIGLFGLANTSTTSKAGAAASAAGDPVMFVIFVLAYVTTLVAALNKCFAAISIIPQQVIRWIGGHGEAIESPTQELRQTVDSASGKAGGGMGQLDSSYQKAGASSKAERLQKSQEMGGSSVGGGKEAK